MNKLLLLLTLAVSLPTWAQTSGTAPVPVNFTSSDLPIIVITSDSTIVDDPKVEAKMGIIDNGPGQRNALTDPFNNYNGNIGIEIRGSASQSFPKKSYGLETHDASGADADISLLGMPAGSDWILSAVYADKSLMRNVLMYNLAREAGSYASRTRYCELVINGSYRGVYAFMEKLKRGADRINISKLKSSDKTGDAVTGGYILKLDKLTGTLGANWTSKLTNTAISNPDKIVFQVEYPKLDDINTQQLNYIQAYVDSFETALNSIDYADTRNGYRHYINTSSFIDYFLLTELSRNTDGYIYSTYFYKDRTSKNGKLTMGPVWDYDIAWGNADYCSGASAQGWVYNSFCSLPHVPFWWQKLLQDPAFSRELNARWTALRSTTLSEQHIFDQIDTNAALVAESKDRNFTAWPILNTYVWPNAAVFATYPEEVAYLKQWIHNRLLWMDNNLTREPNAVTANKAPTTITAASAYPIPFTTSLALAYSLQSASELKVVLVDALGKQVYQRQLPLQAIGSHTLTIEDCEQLVPGMYYVQLISNTGCQNLRVQHTTL
jgi:hypothetical protein